MHTRQELSYLDKLHVDILKLILSHITPDDFVNIRQVCMSLKECLDNKTTVGKRILETKPTFFERTIGKINTKNHPWLFFLSTSLLSNSIMFPEVFKKSLLNALLNDPVPTCLTGLFNIGISSLLGLIKLALGDPIKKDTNLNTLFLENTSVGSLMLTLMFSIGSRTQNNLIYSVIGTSSLLLTYCISVASIENLNEYSFFCQNKPKELYKSISQLLKKEALDGQQNHQPRLEF